MFFKIFLLLASSALFAKAFLFPMTSDKSTSLLMSSLSDFPRAVRAKIPFRAGSADEMLRDFVNTFEEAWSVGANQEKGSRIPIDARETETHYEVYADLPGASKENTKIEIEEHVLTITTERKTHDPADATSYRRLERYSGTYSRSLRLPEDADEEKISASFKDGVMTIRITKLLEDVAKGRKKVAIEYE